jgi:hypothetical protein
MMKLDPATPNTDAGWVYGTVTPDGKTVTSSGKVETCLKCHVEAPGDRLFGIASYRPMAAPFQIDRLGGKFTIDEDLSGFYSLALRNDQGAEFGASRS